MLQKSRVCYYISKELKQKMDDIPSKSEFIETLLKMAFHPDIEFVVRKQEEKKNDTN